MGYVSEINCEWKVNYFDDNDVDICKHTVCCMASFYCLWTECDCFLTKFGQNIVTRLCPESVNLHQGQNLNQKWSVVWIRISGLIHIPYLVWWIGPKMLWIHYSVSICHFAKRRENLPITVWEMLINLLKYPVPQWWGKWKSDVESVSGPDHHQRLIRASLGVLIGRPSDYTKFQWNSQAERQTYCTNCITARYWR